MICPSCRHANPETARFCENCGTKLSRACPNCSNPVSPGAKFCGNCGFALEAAPAAAPAPPADPLLERLKRLVPKEFADRLLASRGARIEGERKVVTILFSDVKGSTSLGEERDPEEVLEIMNGAFDVLIEPIYRYEGTLARLMGDAILAFFGAPIAHEDDPVRAVLAARAIQDKMAEYAASVERRYGVSGFGVRVGINTGLVVVGEVGSDLRVEYTAMGDAINLASRLEGAADPGMIVISESTARQVRHTFDLEALGPLQLKGKAEAVAAYRVVAPKAAPESARGIEGLRSPLVGREREMRSLQSRVEELSAGRGQIVSIMGEAGLGKSRLAAELRQWATKNDEGRRTNGESRTATDDRRPATEGGGRSSVIGPRSSVHWVEGRSQSFETTTPYAPFADLFRRLFRLTEAAADGTDYEAVKAGLAARLPGRADELAPPIASLLGIQPTGDDLERVRYLEPPQMRARTFRAVADFLEGLAAQSPLVLAMEDVHWIDATSLDLLEGLLPLTDRAPVMILALFRPHRQEPSWRFHETAARDYPHRYTPVVLEPLDENSSRTLVANLLEIEDLPEKVRALILAKAEGNPFFVEEVIRSLLDARLVVREGAHWRATRAIQNIAVPDTLAGVITARLDRLDDDSKRAAQTAAVIGREFREAVLADVYEPRPALPPALGTLQRRELIRERGRAPEPLYAFKHALTQETAYGSVLMSKRRELHRRVAECLERTAPDHVNDIARHFLEARLESRALPYLVEAADRAARTYATPEAIGFYRKALDIMLVTEGGDLARRAFEGLGKSLTLIGDLPGAIDNYQAMLARARNAGDVPMQVSALNKLAYVLSFVGQHEEAERNLIEGERLARETQDPAGLAELFMIRCGMCTLSADFDGAMNYLGSAVQVGRDLNLKEQEAFGVAHIANTLTFMARFDDAWEKAQEALRLAEELGHKQHVAEMLSFPIPSVHLRNGDWDAAQRAAEQARAIAADIGAAYDHTLAAWMLGEMAQARGEYERAISFYESALGTARESGYGFMELLPLGGLLSVYTALGGAYAARIAEYETAVLQGLAAPGGVTAGGTAWNDLGFACLARGEVERAGEFFRTGLTVPTTTGNLQKPRFFVGAALVALTRGEVEAADRHVAEARAFAGERGMRQFQPLIELAAGRVAAARGDLPRALEMAARAEALAQPMGLRPIIGEARALAAEALAALGRAAEADLKRREAQAMRDEIAGLFADEAMRAAYLGMPLAEPA